MVNALQRAGKKQIIAFVFCLTAFRSPALGMEPMHLLAFQGDSLEAFSMIVEPTILHSE